MLRRLLKYSPSLSKQMLWKVPSATYCDKQTANSVAFKKDREKEAEDFLANLDEAGLEKMKEIKELHKVLKAESFHVPEIIPITSWKVLITEYNSYTSRSKYFKKLFLDEMAKKNDKKRREERRKERERKIKEIEEKGDLRLPQFSINYVTRNKMELNWSKLKALRSDIDVIIDLDIDQREREYIHSSSQIQNIIGLNYAHLQPLNIHLTSIHKNKHLERYSKFSKVFGSQVHREHFGELFNKSDLVYLSPDGPPMNKFDSECTFIIGGFVDLECKKHHTLGIARQLGIRSASFPIRTHCDLRLYERNTVLTLDAVFGILLEMYLHGSWETAFKKILGYKYPLYKDIQYEGFQDQFKLLSERRMSRKYQQQRQDLT